MNKSQLFDKIQVIIESYTSDLDSKLDKEIDIFVKDNSILKTVKSVAINNTNYNILTDILNLIYEEVE